MSPKLENYPIGKKVLVIRSEYMTIRPGDVVLIAGHIGLSAIMLQGPVQNLCFNRADVRLVDDLLPLDKAVYGC